MERMNDCHLLADPISAEAKANAFRTISCSSLLCSTASASGQNGQSVSFPVSKYSMETLKKEAIASNCAAPGMECLLRCVVIVRYPRLASLQKESKDRFLFSKRLSMFFQKLNPSKIFIFRKLFVDYAICKQNLKNLFTFTSKDVRILI